jgi:hypothetical protein
MDITALSTPTQMILAAVMIVILLGWFIIFATLSIRSNPPPKFDDQEAWDDLPTPARSFPAVTVPVGQRSAPR